MSDVSATKVDQSPQRLREAREHGHLATSPPLYDVLVRQARLERRITTLEELMAAAQVVTPTAEGVAEFGTYARARETVNGRPNEREQRDRLDKGILRFAIGRREVDSAGGIVRFGVGPPGRKPDVPFDPRMRWNAGDAILLDTPGEDEFEGARQTERKSLDEAPLHAGTERT